MKTRGGDAFPTLVTDERAGMAGARRTARRSSSLLPVGQPPTKSLFSAFGSMPATIAVRDHLCTSRKRPEAAQLLSVTALSGCGEGALGPRKRYSRCQVDVLMRTSAEKSRARARLRPSQHGRPRLWQRLIVLRPSWLGGFLGKKKCSAIQLRCSGTRWCHRRA